MFLQKYHRKKSIESIIKQVESSKQLKRSLGAFQLIMLGIGAIIGAGIFVLAGTAASKAAGPAVMISFALSGMACACAGLCYAELSSAIPASGSAYTFIYVALGEFFAFITAFLMIVGTCFVVASIANGWSGYAVATLADFNIDIPAIFTNNTGCQVDLKSGATVTALFNLPAFFISILVALILCRGVHESSIINTVIVFVKMSVLIAFVILGIKDIEFNNWIPFIPENTGTFGEFGISGIVGGASMVLLAYNGFDTVATAAQETKNPQRDLPIGILVSLLIAVMTYMLVSGVLTGMINYKDLNVSQPIALAVDKMAMPWFALVIKLGAVMGLTSVVLVMSYGLVRVIYAVTNDGLLPKFLGKIHQKNKVPHIATIFVGLAIGIISATMPLDQTVQLGNFCVMVVFILVCFATIYLRYKEPNLKRSFKCPGMPWIPIVGILLFLQILAGIPDTIIYCYFLLVVVLAVLVYFLYGQKNSILRQE